MCGRYSLAPRWNIAPGTDVPAIAAGGQTELRWGLTAPWLSRPLVNVRSETAQAKFGDECAHGRCLLPADGFYEWRGREAHRVTRADSAPFRFAALERGGTCAILTTRANGLIAPIHARMPVMLAPEEEEPWLEGALPVGELAPWPAEETCVYRVGPAVNDARHDGPDCAEPAATLF